ncbi:ParB/RepB/Spo0J family partition protein [Leptolyngbya ohadii]|uniref:ParB/RepB/Spo0J family partition protein n=1 Tax=Leptolyngbya ohadii TaxID=1962290 RepID=UPI001CEC4721|nr:ParB/RepB/Spo0J family partition protein [Leptolyngbya ohadii]
MSSKRDKSYGAQIRRPSSLSPLDDIYGTAEALSEQRTIALNQIRLPERQPRRYFDPQAYQQLVTSIRQHGILQPLVVRPIEAGYFELVAGERRLRVAREIGLDEVPIVERELDEVEAFEIALTENLFRENLNPVDETEGILQLLAFRLDLDIKDVPPLLYRLNNGASQPKVAASHNVMANAEDFQNNHNVMANSEDAQANHNVMTNSDLQAVEALFTDLGLMTWRSFVKNRLPLLRLPDDVLALVRSGKLEYTKAKAIAQVKEQEARTAVLERAIVENWSLQQIKEHLKRLKPVSKQIPLKEQFESTYKKAKKLKVWDMPDKQKQLEKLLTELNELLGEAGTKD